jgi:hypothetical protein
MPGPAPGISLPIVESLLQSEFGDENSDWETARCDFGPPHF